MTADREQRLTLRMREVASQTGVSLTTVKGWCSSGALTSVRIGGVVLVKPEDLTAFLDAHREGLAVTPLRHHARPRRKQSA